MNDDLIEIQCPKCKSNSFIDLHVINDDLVVSCASCNNAINLKEHLANHPSIIKIAKNAFKDL